MISIKLFITGISLLLAGMLQAQVSVNVNVGSPPMWGPAGYSDVHYYYLPDVEAYYDVPSSMFIYQSGGVWVHKTYLPTRYRNYDLYNGYKVVMTDYRGNTPYVYYKEHKAKYYKGYHGPAQKNIGERPGKGNYKAKAYSGGHSERSVNQGRGKSEKHGNGNNSKEGRGGGGHGKKK